MRRFLKFQADALCSQFKNKQELDPRLGSICALCKQLDFRVVCSLLSVCL